MDLGTRSQDLLRAFTKNAPKMGLGEAMQYVDDLNRIANDSDFKTYIILKLLEALSVDGNGTMKDKAIIEAMLKKDDKVWEAYCNAISIHGGISCGVPGYEITMQEMEKRYFNNDKSKIEMAKFSYDDR